MALVKCEFCVEWNNIKIFLNEIDRTMSLCVLHLPIINDLIILIWGRGKHKKCEFKRIFNVHPESQSG